MYYIESFGIKIKVKNFPEITLSSKKKKFQARGPIVLVVFKDRFI